MKKIVEYCEKCGARLVPGKKCSCRKHLKNSQVNTKIEKYRHRKIMYFNNI